MRNIINNLSTALAIGLAALCADISTDAQQVQYFGGLSGNPLNGAMSVSTNNTCAAASTNTYYSFNTATNTLYTNGVISGTNILNVVSSTNEAVISGSKIVTIQPSYTMPGLVAAGNSNVVFRVDNSDDNQIWNVYTNLSVPYAGTGAGPATNVSTATFNIDTGGALYWRVGQVQNTNVTFISNIVVAIGKKLGF